MLPWPFYVLRTYAVGVLAGFGATGPENPPIYLSVAAGYPLGAATDGRKKRDSEEGFALQTSHTQRVPAYRAYAFWRIAKKHTPEYDDGC